MESEVAKGALIRGSVHRLGASSRVQVGPGELNARVIALQ